MKTSYFSILIALSLLVVLSGCTNPISVPVPPTQVPVTTPTVFEMPLGSGETWQLVILSDSTLWGVGEVLADRIEKDTGVTVEYIDYALGDISAGKVLTALQAGESPNWRLDKLPNILRDAEMVVMFQNPRDSIVPENPLGLEECFASLPPKNCDPSAFEQWTADLNAIWGEILKLRAGQPTILRAVDIYNPMVQPWKENGVYEECTICWENQSDAARLAAEPYNIPFLSRFDMMNGPVHDEDPRLKGFILEDGEHPSGLGAQYMADLLADMGYDPVIPPEE